MQEITGKAVFGGIAIGPIAVYHKAAEEIKETTVGDPEKEFSRFEEAVEKAREELQELYDKAVAEVGEENAAVFEVHQMMLEDDDYLESVEGMIKDESLNAEYAVHKTACDFAAMFSEMEDEYMQARAADVKDVSSRVIKILSGREESGVSSDKPVILLAEDLAPSETVQLDKSKILSFVTRLGSANSHTSILARTMNIPALISVDYSDDMEGKSAIVDGFTGKLIIDPDDAALKHYQELLAKE
ncbi:MAG: phosphoenolpyruvate--protein phosphotransferase, partial [Lachnospiraceae bacterium]|nr:phosphoenolpyruvate--protein phosphotransferase [Lachnospiraceae bacterium]